jgi:hypothetical protein
MFVLDVQPMLWYVKQSFIVIIILMHNCQLLHRDSILGSWKWVEVSCSKCGNHCKRLLMLRFQLCDMYYISHE